MTKKSFWENNLFEVYFEFLVLREVRPEIIKGEGPMTYNAAHHHVGWMDWSETSLVDHISNRVYDLQPIYESELLTCLVSL